MRILTTIARSKILTDRAILLEDRLGESGSGPSHESLEIVFSNQSLTIISAYLLIRPRTEVVFVSNGGSHRGQTRIVRRWRKEK